MTTGQWMACVVGGLFLVGLIATALQGEEDSRGCLAIIVILAIAGAVITGALGYW